MSLFSMVKRLLVGSIVLCGVNGVAGAEEECGGDWREAGYRFEAESIEGSVKFEQDTLLGGKGIWAGTGECVIAMPEGGGYDVWVRYFDNGARRLNVAAGDAEVTLGAQSSGAYWSWGYVGKVEVEDTVKLVLKGIGKHAAGVDSVLLVRDEGYNPNEATMAEWAEVQEVFGVEGFAKKLWREHKDEMSMEEWARRVCEHYGAGMPPEQFAATVDGYGNILHNGEPYFQLGMFHASVHDERLFDVAVNCFIGGLPGEDDERDISVVLPYSSRWRAYDVIAEELAAIGGDERLLMHYICDEPENVGVSAEELKQLNVLVKSLDPGQATFVNVSPNMSGNRAVLTIPDVVGLDQYPIPGGRVADIGGNIDLMRLSSEGRPVVFIAQSFNWGAYGREGARYPTAAEVRAMSYLALIHYAKGLWFYEWPAPTMGSKTCLADIEPALWSDMLKLIDEINVLKPALLGLEVAWPYEVTLVEGKAKRMPEFRLAVDAERRGAYLMAVQPWNEEATVRVTWGDSILADTVLGEALTATGMRCEMGNGEVTMQFAGMGSAVIEVESGALGELRHMPKGEALAGLQERFDQRMDRPEVRLVMAEGDDDAGAVVDLLDCWKSSVRPQAAELWASDAGVHLRVATRFPKDKKSTHLERDGAIWGDPCIEIFLGKGYDVYGQLAVNTANVQFDQLCDMREADAFDAGVDYVWESSVEAGNEQAEYWVMIPWGTLAELDIYPGDTMLFNVASGMSRWDWSGLTGGGYHVPRRYGKVHLPKR